MIELPAMPKDVNNDSIPISDGIVPVIELPAMRKDVNDDKIPISDGIVPVIELLSR